MSKETGLTEYPYKIRPARSDDADEVFRLAVLLATSEVPERAAFDSSYAHMLDDPRQAVLVAESNDALLGYVQGLLHPAFHANGDVAWVEEIVVNHEARGGGIGRALMAAFENWARTSVRLSYFALATRRAAKFYRSLGYEESATYFKKRPEAGSNALDSK